MSTLLYKALRRLLPKGHAFYLFPGGQHQLVIEATAEYPQAIKEFYETVRDSGIPGRIPADVLPDWEALYLLSGAGLTDAQRNAQILSRENAVGGLGADYQRGVLNDAFQSELDYPLRYVITAAAGPTAWTAGDPDVTAGQFEVPDPDEAELFIYENQGDPKAFDGELVVRGLDDDRALLEALTSEYYPGVYIISGPDGPGSWLEMPAARKDDFILRLLQLKMVSRWVIVQIRFI